jgi:hypothetical protein
MSASTISNSSASKYARNGWNAIKRHAKEHHESVSLAYQAYYGVPTGGVVTQRHMQQLPNAAAAGPSSSASSAASSSSPRSSFDRAWGSVKRHAREHHRSVTAAHAALYGTAAAPLPRA